MWLLSRQLHHLEVPLDNLHGYAAHSGDNQGHVFKELGAARTNTEQPLSSLTAVGYLDVLLSSGLPTIPPRDASTIKVFPTKSYVFTRIFNWRQYGEKRAAHLKTGRAVPPHSAPHQEHSKVTDTIQCGT